VSASALTDDDRLKIIGTLVSEYRKKRGLSQTELAKIIGERFQPFVSDLERGRMNIRILQLEQIAKALHVRLSEFTIEYERRCRQLAGERSEKESKQPDSA
jgi:transcriptional regulator with XRE-family HTH domain